MGCSGRRAGYSQPASVNPRFLAYGRSAGTSVGHGVAEPERDDDDRDDPQEVRGQPDQAEQQRGAQDAGDNGVWSALLPQ